MCYCLEYTHSIRGLIETRQKISELYGGVVAVVRKIFDMDKNGFKTLCKSFYGFNAHIYNRKYPVEQLPYCVHFVLCRNELCREYTYTPCKFGYSCHRNFRKNIMKSFFHFVNDIYKSVERIPERFKKHISSTELFPLGQHVVSLISSLSKHVVQFVGKVCPEFFCLFIVAEYVFKGRHPAC